ncbi:MAG: protoheme IX farnesyltransferase [Hyphomicrobium sp.]|jgi:protoheme IX farnesyltransferase|nr:protoheme IX farnesyltransferase [Hyphomicrobium sp.]
MTTATAGPLIKDVLSIFKLRIGIAIMLSAIGGMAITPGELPGFARASILALAVLLASASAGAFNQWAEADLDVQMKRTASRPFASGRFRADLPWLGAILGLLAIAVMMAAWSANWWAAFHTFMGAFVYGIIYTVWLKRRSWVNIVVGGLAGSFAVLAGAALVHPGWHPEPVILSLVLFLWTPPHFWSLAIASHEDYAAAGVPMLPVVAGDALTSRVILAHTILLVGLSLLPVFWSMGLIYFICAATGGALFIGTSIRLAQAPCPKRAIQNFLASLVQLVLLLSGTVLDRAFGIL